MFVIRILEKLLVLLQLSVDDIKFFCCQGFVMLINNCLDVEDVVQFGMDVESQEVEQCGLFYVYVLVMLGMIIEVDVCVFQKVVDVFEGLVFVYCKLGMRFFIFYLIGEVFDG